MEAGREAEGGKDAKKERNMKKRGRRMYSFGLRRSSSSHRG